MKDLLKLISSIDDFAKSPNGVRSAIGVGVFLGLLFVWNFPGLVLLIISFLIVPPIVLVITTKAVEAIEKRKTP